MEELSLDEAIKASRPLSPATVKEEDRWPSHYKQQILEAIESDAKEVNIGGKMYQIRYYENDRYFLQPFRGFFPCGWIHRSWLTS